MLQLSRNSIWTASAWRLGLALSSALFLALGGVADSANAAVIAHWSFDEINGSNQFEDDSGNAYHATIADQNTSVTPTAALTLDTADKVFGAGAGNFNRGGALDPLQGTANPQNDGIARDGGPGAYAAAPHVEGIYTGSHTVATWMKVFEESAWTGILGDWTDGRPAGDWGTGRSYLYGLTGDSAGANKEKPMIALSGAGGNSNINFSATSTPEFTKDVWHHVAWVVDRFSAEQSNIAIYVDGNPTPFKSGVFPGTASNADIRDNTQNPTWIGLKEDNGMDYHGKLDELWIFEKALSIGEIQSLMNNNVIPEPATVTLLGVVMLIVGALRPRCRA